MLHKSKKGLLEGNITEQLILFSYPIIGANLLSQAYSTIDKIILGRIVSTEALAAVGGSATTIINCIINLIGGIATAATVLVAHGFGSGSRDKVVNTIKTSMWLCVVMGGLLGVIGCVSAKTILLLMGIPQEILSSSLTYMYCYCASLIPYMFYIVGTSILRAMGDSKRPFFMVIVIAVVKISFDILLAGVFKLGVLGTSLSTGLSYLVCGALIIIIFMYTPDFYQYSILDFGFDKEILMQTLKMGIPAGLQSVTFSLTVGVMQVKLNTFGTKAIAAYTIFSDVENFYWNITNGFGTALITVVGQNYGNKNYARVKKIIKRSVLIDLIICLVMGAFCYFVGPYIAKLFSDDLQVIEIVKGMLHTCPPFFFLYVGLEVFSNTMKACGDSTQTMIISIIFIVLLRVFYIMFAPITNTNILVFMFPFTWIFAGSAFIIYYLVAKKYKVIREQ